MECLKRGSTGLVVLALLPVLAHAQADVIDLEPDPFGARQIDLHPSALPPEPVSMFTVGRPESRWPQLRLTLAPEKRVGMKPAKWRPEIRMSSLEATKALRNMGLPVRTCETVLRSGSRLGGEIAGGGVRVMVSARFNCGY